MAGRTIEHECGTRNIATGGRVCRLRRVRRLDRDRGIRRDCGARHAGGKIDAADYGGADQPVEFDRLSSIGVAYHPCDQITARAGRRWDTTWRIAVDRVAVGRERYFAIRRQGEDEVFLPADVGVDTLKAGANPVSPNRHLLMRATGDGALNEFSQRRADGADLDFGASNPYDAVDMYLWLATCNPRIAPD